MSQNTKSIGTWLTIPQSDLTTLLAKSQALNTIQERLEAYIEPAFAAYYQVSNLIEGRLVLQVANGSIATQLRLQANALIASFADDPILRGIKLLDVKVRPPASKGAKKIAVTKVAPLSEETANIIRETAEGIQDAKLKAVMLRLSEHTE